MILNDFRCQVCDTVFEGWGNEARCVECNSENTVAIITGCNFKVDGTDPDFPTAWDQWNKKREKKMAQERKQLED